VLFYSLAYAFMNMGAFAIVILASGKERERLVFRDYAGLGYVEPLVAFAMFVFMLSLAGIPLTAGFAGKFQIFKAAMDQGFVWLTVAGVLNSVVSVYYYLRIVVAMYMERPGPDAPRSRAPVSPSLYAAIALALLGVLYLGVFPSASIEAALQSVGALVVGR
jgi:NADH-quinone oxidoreductase subunit N